MPLALSDKLLLSARELLSRNVAPYPFTFSLLQGVLVAAMLALIAWLLWRMLRPKYVFFVRHGQTVLNAQRIRQQSAGGLTDSGIHQAERMGAFLAPLNIRKIYASPYERTRQTASILQTFLRCDIRYSPLFTERRNPTEIVGKSADDPAVRRIADQMDLTFHADDFRVSDEENFLDLKKRASRALRFLERRGEARLCVVTHGIFLKLFIAYLLYRDSLHAPDWVKLSFFSPADNAGLTLCVYRPLRRFSPTHGWEVLSYNITVPEHSPMMGQGMANINDLVRKVKAS